MPESVHVSPRCPATRPTKPALIVRGHTYTAEFIGTLASATPPNTPSTVEDVIAPAPPTPQPAVTPMKGAELDVASILADMALVSNTLQAPLLPTPKTQLRTEVLEALSFGPPAVATFTYAAVLCADLPQDVHNLALTEENYPAGLPVTVAPVHAAAGESAAVGYTGVPGYMSAAGKKNLRRSQKRQASKHATGKLFNPAMSASHCWTSTWCVAWTITSATCLMWNNG
jgi:hypothetical protein